MLADYSISCVCVCFMCVSVCFMCVCVCVHLGLEDLKSKIKKNKEKTKEKKSLPPSWTAYWVHQSFPEPFQNFAHPKPEQKGNKKSDPGEDH